MARYHINSSGNTGQCGATVGRCPFGGEENHFESLAEARAANEERMAKDFGGSFGGAVASKPVPPSNNELITPNKNDSLEDLQKKLEIANRLAASKASGTEDFMSTTNTIFDLQTRIAGKKAPRAAYQPKGENILGAKESQKIAGGNAAATVGSILKNENMGPRPFLKSNFLGNSASDGSSKMSSSMMNSWAENKQYVPRERSANYASESLESFSKTGKANAAQLSLLRNNPEMLQEVAEYGARSVDHRDKARGSSAGPIRSPYGDDYVSIGLGVLKDNLSRRGLSKETADFVTEYRFLGQS